eukprot:g566.t1
MSNLTKELTLTGLAWVMIYSCAYYKMHPMIVVFSFFLYFANRLHCESLSANTKKVKVASKIDKLVRSNEDISLVLNDIPEWVRFPHKANCKWLSDLIEALWPALRPALNTMLVDTLNQSLQGDWGHPLKSIAFTEFDLGSEPLSARGITSTKIPGSCVWDINVFLCCSKDSQLVLKLGLDAVGDVPITINNIFLKGELRIEFLEIAGELPCFNFIGFSFTETPVIDFSLEAITKQYDLLHIPGVHGLVQNVLRSVVGSAIVWPQKYLYPMRYDDEVLKVGGLDSATPAGKVEIFVYHAKNIMPGDRYHTHLSADPQLEITLARAAGIFSKRTGVCKDTLSPRWNVEFNFDLLAYDGDFTFTIWDHHHGNESDDKLGVVKISIADIEKKFKTRVLDENGELMPIGTKPNTGFENSELKEDDGIGDFLGYKVHQYGRKTVANMELEINVPEIPNETCGLLSLQVVVTRYSQKQMERWHKTTLEKKIQEYMSWEDSVNTAVRDQKVKLGKRSWALLNEMRRVSSHPVKKKTSFFGSFFSKKKTEEERKPKDEESTPKTSDKSFPDKIFEEEGTKKIQTVPRSVLKSLEIFLGQADAILYVTIKSCNGLAKHFTKPSPYCVLALGKQSTKIHVCHNTLEPVWNCVVKMPVRLKDRKSLLDDAVVHSSCDTLTIEMRDSSLLRHKQLLGTCTIDLGNLMMNGGTWKGGLELVKPNEKGKPNGTTTEVTKPDGVFAGNLSVELALHILECIPD